MANLLNLLKVKNYRSLADVSVETGQINILFGPNGAGKSTFLDIIWFVRDCAIRSVELASSSRSHGIGILYDGASDDALISITLATRNAEYQLTFGLSSGRIEPFAGERLHSKRRDIVLIDRKVASDKASFHRAGSWDDAVNVQLREPEKLSMGRYLDFEDGISEAADMDRLLRFVHYHHSRSIELYRIKHLGSDSSHEHWLWERCGNLWSVLRNLHDRKSQDARWDTIMRFMAEGFPAFDGILIEQTGPSTVYGSFLEKGRRKPIRASGVSDGHLQLLILLTSLFAEGQGRDSLMLLDEPEISLHPWAQVIFARATRLASEQWNKQIFVATQSPVLISQFEPQHVFVVEQKDGKTEMRRLNEIAEIQDLLREYPVGALYESEAVAPQRRLDAGKDA